MKRIVHKKSPLVIGDYPCSILLVTTKIAHDISSNNHIHQEFEIIVVKNGNLSIVVNKERYLINENDVFFINCRQPHTISPVSAIAEYYCISIEDNFIAFDFKNAIFKNDIKKSNKYFELISRFISEFEKSTVSSEYAQKSILFELLNTLLEDGQVEILTNSKEFDEKTLSKINAAITYINKNYMQKITIDELCKASNFSRSWFFFLFKKITGHSPNSMITSLRLKSAINLIETSNSSISDIAFSVGFPDMFSFNTAFKKQYAMSPRDYRERFIQVAHKT